MHVGVSGGCHSGARGSLIMGCRWEVLRSQRQASDTGQCQNELVSHYKDVRASMYLPQRCYFRVTLIAGRPEGVRFSRPPPPPLLRRAGGKTFVFHNTSLCHPVPVSSGFSDRPPGRCSLKARYSTPQCRTVCTYTHASPTPSRSAKCILYPLANMYQRF